MGACEARELVAGGLGVGAAGPVAGAVVATVDAGAVASDIYLSGIADGTIDKTKTKIIDTSFDIPGSPIAVRGDISQGDQDAILQALLAINDRPMDDKLFTSFVLKGGFGVGTVKLIKGDDAAYNDLRKIPPAIGIDLKKLGG